MDIVKVDYVEIGFRFIDKIKTKGPCAYSEENFLKSLKIPNNLKIAVMINAADFVNQKNLLETVKKKIEKFYNLRLKGKYLGSYVPQATLKKVYGIQGNQNEKNFFLLLKYLTISLESLFNGTIIGFFNFFNFDLSDKNLNSLHIALTFINFSFILF